mgnify:CR=1 FL=1
MKKIKNTQWHPAFCSAIRLELREDKEFLEYFNEYNLNTKPLQIDLLIIKKLCKAELRNEIGKIFRKHNILEYKSKDDSMNVDTFIKVIGYACIYKAAEKNVNSIRLDEITITLVRERIPRELFKWFRKRGFLINEQYKGIFYVMKKDCFPIQVLVSGRLSKENQKWLTLLNTDLGQDDVQRFVEQNNGLHQKEEKELADSVLQVAMMENREVFEETKKEGDYMCEALRELFSDEIEAEKARARREGREEGIAEGRAEGMAKGRAEGRVEGLAAGMAEGRAEERAESQNVISKLQEQIELLNQTVVELKIKLSKLEEA